MDVGFVVASAGNVVDAQIANNTLRDCAVVECARQVFLEIQCPDRLPADMAVVHALKCVPPPPSAPERRKETPGSVY